MSASRIDTMNHDRTIAILADLPLWAVTDRIAVPKGPFPVWLQALYSSSRLLGDWQIHWVILHRKARRQELISIGNQHFHIIPQGMRSVGVLTGYAVDRFHIKRVLEQIKPDLVHAWGTETPYALAGTDFHGKRLLSVQGILTSHMQRAPVHPFMRCQALWEQVALKGYPDITVESPWGRDRLLEIVPDARVALIEYGVEPFVFDIVKQLDPQPSCLYAGAISKLKGSDTLIDSFSSPELSHIQLRIAGDGEKGFVNKLKERSSPNITFLGPIARHELARELARTWCLVHPTLADTSPNIVKEARCCGTPVVTTPEGGQTQYVTDGKSGFICPVHDIPAMIEAILTVTASPGQSLNMGAFDQERCRQELHPDLTAERFMALYRRLLDETD